MPLPLHGRLLLASVLLEPRRWRSPGERFPSLAVSTLSGPARRAGFDGWELWDRHWLNAEVAEQGALAPGGPMPVAIWNGYDRLDEPASWATTARAAAAAGAVAIKFNFPFGTMDQWDPVRLRDQAAAWAASVPAGISPWCECHAGTVAETPEAAAALLAALGRDDWGVIVHPLSGTRDDLRRWIDAFGPRIAHLHLQARDARGRWAPVRTRLAELRHRLALLEAGGFRGSASLEFTAGIGRPGECPESLFAEAAADLAAVGPAWKELAA